MSTKWEEDFRISWQYWQFERAWWGMWFSEAKSQTRWQRHSSWHWHWGWGQLLRHCGPKCTTCGAGAFVVPNKVTACSTVLAGPGFTLIYFCLTVASCRNEQCTKSDSKNKIKLWKLYPILGIPKNFSQMWGHSSRNRTLILSTSANQHLKKKKIKVFQSQSLDLNLTEMLWQDLKRAVQK